MRFRIEPQATDRANSAASIASADRSDRAIAGLRKEFLHESHIAWGGNGPRYSGNSAKGAAGHRAALAESDAEPNCSHAARVAPAAPRSGGARHTRRAHA